MELENKLAAYRAKKKREETINHFKDNVKSFFNWNKASAKVSPEQEEPLIINETIPEPKLPEKVINKTIFEEKPKLEPKEPTSLFTISLYAIGLIIWGYLYYIFIQLQFGIVFLTVSALFGIYFNTRTGPRDENEISAYSVFNRNCESIDGTLKAEQFEREIRFGAQSVH